MNKQQLASKIWAAANEMRSKIEASEYKDYILGFIFYKFLSDQEESYLIKNGASLDELKEIEEYSEMAQLVQDACGYFIAYDNLFSTWVRKKQDFGVGDVTVALSAFKRLINPSHKHVFTGIFDTLDTGLKKLGDSATAQSKAVQKLVDLINSIPMNTKQDYDVLGFVYEYLISNFAANAGKKAGEFYTPHEVSILMSEIIANLLRECDEIKIYDPTSGSGSLLINIGQSVAKHIQGENKVKYYAQELKENTYNLTRMNLVMRGILPDNIVTRCGDTLEDDWPYFDDNDKENTYEPLTNLDAVVSNPPYSQKWDPTDKSHDPRFHSYGVAPKSKADYAFLLHDLYHLRTGGIMTIVLPHGVLFRGGEEETIRHNLIEANNIDAIIGLPANIFFGTGIPTIVMVLKKGRSEDDVLIIDASKGFAKEGKNNKLRARDIKKIVDTYIGRLEIEKFSRRVSRAEIRQNEYNLNIPRYVDSSEPAESWDIYATMFGGLPKKEIAALGKELDVFPTLIGELFTESDTPYVALRSDDIKEIIENNAEVKAFTDAFFQAFSDFADYLRVHLVDNMESLSIPKEEDTIVTEIFERLTDIPLVDKYEAYQLFEDEWRIISGDLEMLQTEGKQVVTQVDPNMVPKKKDNGVEEVQDGWRGHILPFDFIQHELLGAELEEIASLYAQLSEIASQYEEIIEEIPEEDKDNYLTEDKTAFDRAKVADAIKPYVKGKVKPDVGSVEELLVRADALMTKEKNIKKIVKQKETDLHKKTKETIESLSLADAIDLLFVKWIHPIITALNRLPNSIVSVFENKISALTKKYSVTMLDVESQIASAESDLASMIDDLVGDKYDMDGLKELKNMLVGGDDEQ